ncbi:amylo-alpha-1,6-glucosidase [Calycomorphotria hydatis]|uniref:Amylo-alpha-1,6-glucosidase n=1 Tax=Calycomorphotria hydatis TaxID=2528027 RepID=A0A517T8E5_9PLAN|nr:amylo-alpha-1,6-glucosidase [Calycomorphotria hydatis]QDT64642.1 Amylo-alpha-1,6-glucosidase [Calycomorphotria hydatis]
MISEAEDIEAPVSIVGDPLDLDHAREWLETDGLGGFAMGTDHGARTRRYHGILTCAQTPPVNRVVLVSGLEAWVDGHGSPESISTQIYSADSIQPDGYERIIDFQHRPWPTWTYRLADGLLIQRELFIPRGQSVVVQRWSCPSMDGVAGHRLHVRPLLSGRDFHSLHHCNDDMNLDSRESAGHIRWTPYEHLPSVHAWSNAKYNHSPQWYFGFHYPEEAARGLDADEDLASPGGFHWQLDQGPAVLILAAVNEGEEVPFAELAADKSATNTVGITQLADDIAEKERERRAQFNSPMERAADDYLVKRGEGLSIIAGYPWFSDWGRDTFISLRGLCLATGRIEEAKSILLEWSSTVSEGMLPNRFDDAGVKEFNAVDASLWFIIAVGDLLNQAGTSLITTAERTTLLNAVEEILDGYSSGTRYGIHLDEDGLIAAGEQGRQLTWMDAKVGDWVVTPRIGKPVEIQALWLNALMISPNYSQKWRDHYRRGLSSFRTKFWNNELNGLFDVVDLNHEPGKVCKQIRPNQIFAIGGLPESLLPRMEARKVVDLVEQQLYTSRGLKTLSPDDAEYKGIYTGDQVERDGAYHQGTIWPWLMGPFIEAWVRVRGSTPDVKQRARKRFLEPMLGSLEEAGCGHISEIAEGDRPHLWRGCPFQAWSVAESLRISSEYFDAT